MLPVDVDAMMAAARGISHNIALYVPRTCDVAELTALAAVTSEECGSANDYENELAKHEDDPRNCAEEVTGGHRVGQVEIEQNMLNGRTKTVTAYFGDLILGPDEGEENWEDWNEDGVVDEEEEDGEAVEEITVVGEHTAAGQELGSKGDE